MAVAAVPSLHGCLPLLSDAVYRPTSVPLTAPVMHSSKRPVSPIGHGMRVLLLSAVMLLALGLESRIVVLACLCVPLAIFGPMLLACASSRALGWVGHLTAEVS